MRKLVLTTGLLVAGTAVYAQDQPRSYPRATKAQTAPTAPTINETQIDYPSSLLSEELDFRLTPLADGKFKLDIRTRTKGFFFVKVYDVIGNLLYEEKVRVRGRFLQELDMSQYDSRLFIIEVGNEELNRTKSIVAT